VTVVKNVPATRAVRTGGPETSQALGCNPMVVFDACDSAQWGGAGSGARKPGRGNFRS